jgi:dTDP-4-dehydrorhamnose 3,5-epimerase
MTNIENIQKPATTSTLEAQKTKLNDVLIFKPKIFSDERGAFYESFNSLNFNAQLKLHNNTMQEVQFVQDNHSISSKNVLRGMHYQSEHAQGKLVRVVAGSAFDVVVDIRKNSSTFGQWFGIELSRENALQLWIPPGFAHGFLAISECVEFLYKTTDYRYAQYEQTMMWNDVEVGIEWPINENNPPILSPKDILGHSFTDIICGI